MNTFALLQSWWFWSPLLMGLWMTLKLSLVTLLIGSLLGFVLGVIRALHVPIMAPAIGLIIHLVRGTPFLVQLYIAYFVLPRTGLGILQMEAQMAAILALSLYAATYVAEITRGAMESVPESQVEAAMAMGLNLPQRLALVVLPQAARLMIPPLGGLYVVMVKSTSIVSVVGISELVRAGEMLALRHPRELLLIHGVVALLYFAYCFPLLRLVALAEKRFGRLPSADH
ncbi:MAG: amino acid ABC transporter permease [Bosea sp. (in: a-proteobacteria)]